jgi:acetyl esterase/lipase
MPGESIVIKATCSLLALAASLWMAPLGMAKDGNWTRAEDVIYGRKFGVALTMDVIKPRKTNGGAVVLVVSGGWVSSHDGISSGFCKHVLERGYTVFAVVHGCQPKFTIPEIIEDMNRSIRYIRHHADDYGFDPNRIGIMGGSAGGHLSLMQGVAGTLGDPQAEDPVDRESSRVQAVACLCPPTDFLNYGRPGVVAFQDGPLKGLRAAFDFREMDDKQHRYVAVSDQDRIVEIAKKISPIEFITPDDAPTLIVHGDADKVVPIEQAERMIARLNEAGVHAKLVVKPGAAHGWDHMGDDVATLADWFDANMPAKKP